MKKLKVDVAMLTENFRDEIKTILLEPNISSIKQKTLALRNTNSLSEYEINFTWTLKELSSKLYCFEINTTPFSSLKSSFENNNIVADLQSIVTSSLCKELLARYYDCLWIFKQSFEAAQLAFSGYSHEIEEKNDFDKSHAYLYRLISIYLTLRDDNLKNSVTDTIKLVLKQIESLDNFFPYHILSCCFENNLLIHDEIISECEFRISNNQVYTLTDSYLELIEKAMSKKLSINLNKLITNADLKNVRRKRIDLYLLNARTSLRSHEKIKLYTEAIKLLKKLPDSESELIVIRNELSDAQKVLMTEMGSFTRKIDISKEVNNIIESIDALSPEEYIYYLLTVLPLIEGKYIETATIETHQNNISMDLFPMIMLDKHGKIKTIFPPLDLQNKKSILPNVHNKLVQMYVFQSDVYLKHIVHELKKRGHSFKEDISDIVMGSYFVPESRKQAFISGLCAGYDGDFLTSMSILCPQIENAIRCLAEECGDVVYSIVDQGKESVRTLSDILSLPEINERINEDILFNINAIFDSEYCFNMRNEVAHGLLDDSEFNSSQAMYTWWFIMKLCFLFSLVDAKKLDSIKKKLEPINENYNHNKNQS